MSATPTATATRKVLTPDTINEQVKNVKYAVRGKLVLSAIALEKLIEAAKHKGEPNPLPFDEIIYCNIGNPQQLNQKPLTFVRQVLALVEYPPLLEHTELFPADAIKRAKQIISATGCIGATGAYSHSKGISMIREDVAEFIETRDGKIGKKVDPEMIFLSDGASTSVKVILNLLIKNTTSGILTPVPQYPLYSASIAALNGTQVDYFLDEENHWELNIAELSRALKGAQAKGIETRALVVINPNNPTGQCLSVANMKDIVKFCYDNHLLLMADEVYQDNIYADGDKFTSFRKVMLEMGAPYTEGLELVSFHSVSKGFLGECGKRGGFMQLENISPEIAAEIYKMASVNLCPNVVGQIVTDIMVNPPKSGEPSFELYQKERSDILNSLKKRAQILANALNGLEGYNCQPANGAMYLFPSVALPKKAIAFANSQNETPDSFYALELLKATGICVVPGSGFGQKEGTFHFRTTFLPPQDKMENVVKRMSAFHKEFMDKYRD